MEHPDGEVDGGGGSGGGGGGGGNTHFRGAEAAVAT